MAQGAVELLTPIDVEQERERISEDPDVQSAYDEFLRASGDDSQDVTLRIYRIPEDQHGIPLPNAKNNVWLFETTVDRYTYGQLIEKCRNEFMLPNELQMTIRMIGSKKGDRGIRFNRLVTMRKGRVDPGAPSSPDGSANILTVVTRMMAEQRAETQNLMREFFSRSQQQQPAHDPMQSLSTLITALSPMLAAMAGRPLPEGGSLKDALEVISIAKSLVPGGAPPGESDSTVEIIKAVAPAFPSLLEFMAKAQAAKALAAPPVQAPVPPPIVRAAPTPQPNPQPTPQPAAAPTPAPAGGASDMLLALAANLNQLMGLVAANGVKSELNPQGMDPALIATMTADGLPDELPADLSAILFEPGGIAKLEMLAPKMYTLGGPERVEELKTWFASYFAELQKIYTEE